MTDVNDLPWAERQAAERKGRDLASKHDVRLSGSRNSLVDAIVELLDTQGVRVDAADEIAMREIASDAIRASYDKAVVEERDRILTGLGQIGARLSAAELAVIGRPSSGWWFRG